MDRTALFSACLRAVRTRHKELAASSEQRVLPRRPVSAFQRRAADIVASVARLAAFLAQHRAGYLSSGRGADGRPPLTSAEKDQVDAGAQEIMRTCGQLVRQFRRELVPEKASAGGDHAAQHRRAVADTIEAYLKRVCGVYAEMKAVRVKRSVDRRNMGQIVSGLAQRRRLSPDVDASWRSDGSPPGSGDRLASQTAAAAAAPRTPDWDEAVHHGSGFVDEDAALSAEDQQQLEAENQMMMNELENMTDEVRRVETKVVKIAELQQIFTEKVLEQEKDIDRIGDTVVGTTENIKDANEQLRSAIKKNAGTRVWVMFFLLVMSFSLLFLDWYND